MRVGRSWKTSVGHPKSEMGQEESQGRVHHEASDHHTGASVDIIHWNFPTQGVKEPRRDMPAPSGHSLRLLWGGAVRLLILRRNAGAGSREYTVHSPGRAQGEEPHLHWSFTQGRSDGDSQIQWAALFLGPNKAVPLF